MGWDGSLMGWHGSLVVANDRHKRRRDAHAAGPGDIRVGPGARVGDSSAVVSARRPRRRGADEKMIAVGSERIGLKCLCDPSVLRRSLLNQRLIGGEAGLPGDARVDEL